MDRVDVTETDADLHALLDWVERGEELVIRRHGREVARLVAPLVGLTAVEDVVARARELRAAVAARGESFTWAELKGMRDEDRP